MILMVVFAKEEVAVGERRMERRWGMSTAAAESW